MRKGKPMIEYFNEDCLDGMARYPDKHFELAIVDLKRIKPVCGTFHIRKVLCACYERCIPVLTHPVYGCDIQGKFFANRGLRHCAFKTGYCAVILNSFFIVIGSAQGIYSKIKRFGHIIVAQISNLACVKADKSKNVNLAIVVTLRVILSVTFDIKNIRLAFLRSLRNDSRHSGGLYLNTQKALSIIHENVIRKPLFARKCNKALHNKVCANKVLASFANLEFIAKSHNITSHILYHTYCEMSSAKSNDAVGFEIDADYYKESKSRLEAFMAQQRIETLIAEEHEQLTL